MVSSATSKVEVMQVTALAKTPAFQKLKAETQKRDSELENESENLQ
jgi:hypothetical protein